jgi:hypothetical protein
MYITMHVYYVDKNKVTNRRSHVTGSWSQIRTENSGAITRMSPRL